MGLHNCPHGHHAVIATIPSVDGETPCKAMLTDCFRTTYSRPDNQSYYKDLYLRKETAAEAAKKVITAAEDLTQQAADNDAELQLVLQECRQLAKVALDHDEKEVNGESIATKMDEMVFQRLTGVCRQQLPSRIIQS